MTIVQQVTTTEAGTNWLAGLTDDDRVLVYRDRKIHGKGTWDGSLIHGVEATGSVLGRLERKLSSVVS